MERRIDFRAGLASSLISSSERIQRLISSFKGVRGSIVSNNSVKESVTIPSRSFRLKFLARFAASNKELICRNSGMLKTPPTSKRLIDAPTGWIPEKERLPFRKMRDKASPVCVWAVWIAKRSVIGSRFLHSSFAAWLNANPVRVSIILSYSNVCKTFWFIIISSNSCVMLLGLYYTRNQNNCLVHVISLNLV